MLVKLSPYLIALLIGLLIGIDREQRAMNSRQAMGIRSYILFAMVGALTGGIAQPLFSLGMLVFATSFTLYGYVRTSKAAKSGDEEPIGLTSEIAAMATFVLGYFTHSEPFVSLALGVIVLFILHNKSLFHKFVRSHLRPNEIQSGSVLLLLAVGVVPLIPNYTIDPLNIFNPRKLAMIVVILATIQFGGYVAVRIFGDRIGLPLAGFLAGFASSTAVYLSYPRIAKEKPAHTAAIVGAAVFSITGTLTLLIIVVGVISWQLIVAISIPLFSTIIISAVIGTIFSIRNRVSSSESTQENPINLMRAIKLGVFLTSMIFLVQLVEYYFGLAFTSVLTFLGGLFEMHGVVIASASMLDSESISLSVAASTAMLAVIASMVSKVFITAFMSQGVYRKMMLPIVIGLFAFTAGSWLLMQFVPAMVIKI